METSLIRLSDSYKKATSTKLLELLQYLLFLKNNRLKIILMSKKSYFRMAWSVLFPML